MGHDEAMRARPVLIYDGDCAFCTSSVRFAERRLRPRCEISPGSSRTWTPSASPGSGRSTRSCGSHRPEWCTGVSRLSPGCSRTPTEAGTCRECCSPFLRSAGSRTVSTGSSPVIASGCRVERLPARFPRTVGRVRGSPRDPPSDEGGVPGTRRQLCACEGACPAGALDACGFCGGGHRMLCRVCFGASAAALRVRSADEAARTDVRGVWIRRRRA